MSLPAVMQPLACSRCDGPVRPEDLLDGLAVRVDNQPVCPLCIESLPPALRLQINRVRALKGLAVTTYRVAVPGRPGNRFTFTNSGLVLLHRRALATGTDFETPDLPRTTRQRTAPSERATARPSATQGKHIAIIAGAAAAVLIGIIIVVATSSTERTPPAKTPSDVPTATTPTATIPASQAPTVTAIAPQTTARTAANYLSGGSDTLDALDQAESDNAPTDVIDELLTMVRSETDRQLRMVASLIEQRDLQRAQTMLGQIQIPAQRADLADLRNTSLALRRTLERLSAEDQARQRQQTEAAAAAAAIAPAPAPAPAPISTPTPDLEPIPATTPVPAAPARTSVAIHEWTGPFDKGSGVAVLLDGSETVPIPWPTVASGRSDVFFKSVPAKIPKVVGRRHQMLLSIAGDQVAGGGIGLLIAGNFPSRKQLHLARDDLPAQAALRVEVSRDWRWFTMPVEANPPAQLLLRIEDLDEQTSPFLIGTVRLIAGRLPSDQLVELLPGTLVSPNLVQLPVAKDTLTAALADAATARNEKKRNEVAKAMTFTEGKFLVGGDANTWKGDFYQAIRERWTHDNRMPQYALEPLNLDPTKTIAGLKRIPSPEQSLVVLAPNGQEAGFTAADWAKRVFAISTAVTKGVPAATDGGIPVWVIGQLSADAPAAQASVWEHVRNNDQGRWALIDLTLAQTPGSRMTSAIAHRLIGDALTMLSYRMRWIQKNRIK